MSNEREAMERIQAYLNERVPVRGIDQELIHCMNDKELRASDIAALLAAPIGDNGAKPSGTDAVFAEARKAVEKDMAGFRERLLEMAQPADSKRVELTDEEIDAVWDSVPWKDLNVTSPEHVAILRRRFARALLAASRS